MFKLSKSNIITVIYRLNEFFELCKEDGIFDYNTKGDITKCENDGFEELLRYNDTYITWVEVGTIGDSIRDINVCGIELILVPEDKLLNKTWINKTGCGLEPARIPFDSN